VEYTIKEKKSSEISLECTNNGEEIKDSKKEAYAKLSAKVKIPGFRKGKAPYEIGVRYVGEDRILEEAIETLVDKDLNEVLEKERIIPLGQPEIKVERIENDIFIFSCKVEFFPEVNVDLDEKIRLRYSSNVSEEEISQKVNEIRDSFIELQPKDGKIEERDIVEVSLHYEGHEPQTLTIEAGKDKVVGDFSVQIVGKKKGDLRYSSNVSEEEISQKVNEIRDSFIELQPKDGKIEERDIVEVSLHYEGHEPQTLTIEAGKDKVVGDFSVQIVGKKKGDSFVVKTKSSEVNFEVLSCKKKIVPEIDDELAKVAGFESLDAMKEKIREQLKENKKIHFEENRGREALKNLTEKLNVGLPYKFVDHEVEERLNDLRDRYLKIGKKIEDVIKNENKTMDDFKTEVRKIVETEIKEDLILRKIIRDEKSYRKTKCGITIQVC